MQLEEFVSLALRARRITQHIYVPVHEIDNHMNQIYTFIIRNQTTLIGKKRAGVCEPLDPTDNFHQSEEVGAVKGMNFTPKPCIGSQCGIYSYATFIDVFIRGCVASRVRTVCNEFWKERGE